MSERERLIELLLESEPIKDRDLDNNWYDGEISDIADYLLENGVIVLPVKVGQKVYYIFDGFIESCTVEVIFLADYTDKDGNRSYMAEIHFSREDCPYVATEIYFTDIGKTVFLTKEEAEKALKEASK